MCACVRAPLVSSRPQEKFLHDRVKVNGKAGVLGDHVVIERDASNINVTAKNVQFSKRYLKVCMRSGCARVAASRAVCVGMCVC